MVEDRPDVVRVDAVEDERQHAGLVARAVPMMRRPGIAGSASVRVGQQLVLVRGDRVEPIAAEIIDRRARPTAPAMFGVPASNL